MNLSNTIRQVRLQHGLSTERLGAMLGVSAKTVWNWESGQTKPNRYHQIVLEKLGYLTAFNTPSPNPAIPTRPAGSDLAHTCTTFIAALGYSPSLERSRL